LNHLTNAIERFFKSIEDETAMGNIPAVAEHFSETFLAAGPNGARIAQRSTFAQGLPERKQIFDKLGAQPPRLISLETTVLDARYTMAKPRWQLTFARDGHPAQDIFADSIYIVDTGEEPFKIVLYLTSQDLPKVLAERGILPA
jgi:hypothetical protein